MQLAVDYTRSVARRGLSVATAFAVSVCTCVAQQPATCDPTRLAAVHSVVEDTLRVVLRRRSANGRLNPRFAIEALNALRRHVTLPPSLALPFRMPLTDSVSSLGIALSIDFVALRDGSIGDVRVSRTSYVPALDSAMLQALRLAAAEFAFAPFDSSATGNELPLVIEMAFGLDDSIRVGIDAALVSQSFGFVFPL